MLGALTSEAASLVVERVLKVPQPALSCELLVLIPSGYSDSIIQRHAMSDIFTIVTSLLNPRPWISITLLSDQRTGSQARLASPCYLLTSKWTTGR